MNRTISTATAVALAAGALYGGPIGAEAADGRGGARTTATSFAFQASGYGTRASGGAVPVDSDTSAYEAFGCTNRAGIDRRNFVAVAELPGAGQAEEVLTRRSYRSSSHEVIS